MYIESITVKDNIASKRIDCAQVNVFVGPNNGGKSMLLREAYTNVKRISSVKVIVEDLVCNEEAFSRTVAEQLWDIESTDDPPVRLIMMGGSMVERSDPKNVESVKKEIVQQRPDIARRLVTMLDGAGRLNIIREVQYKRNQENDASLLDMLVQSVDLQERVGSIVKNLVGKRLVLDYTDLGRVRIRLSDDFDFPLDFDYNPRSTEVINWMLKQELLENHSDGIKACWGIISALLIPTNAIIIIDEPEAFLHPHLASKIGLLMAEMAVTEKKQVFLATHSSHLLRGVLDSDATVCITRMEYKRGVSKITPLASGDIRQFIQDPLVSSANATEAFFYDLLVAVEGPSDRGFYQVMAERFGFLDSAKSIKFLDVAGKQNIKRICRAVKSVGIDVVAIKDMDFLRSKDKKASIMSLGVSEAIAKSRADLCGAANEDLIAEHPDFYHADGRHMNYAAINPKIDSVDQAISDVAGCGMFLVPVTVLENWIPPIVGDKSDWFERFIDYSTENGWEKLLEEQWASDLKAFLSVVLA